MHSVLHLPLQWYLDKPLLHEEFPNTQTKRHWRHQINPKRGDKKIIFCSLPAEAYKCHGHICQLMISHPSPDILGRNISVSFVHTSTMHAAKPTNNHDVVVVAAAVKDGHSQTAT